MIEVKDEILAGEPKYRIRDNGGNILYDNLTLEQITEVIEEGTPINKAFFDSIKGDLNWIDRIVTPTLIPNETLHIGDFIPKTWTMVSSKEYISGGYKITSDNSTSLQNAFDGNVGTSATYNGTLFHIILECPTKIKISKMKIFVDGYSSLSFVISGSNDNTNWTTLRTTGKQDRLTDIELTTKGYYKYYKFYINASTVFIYELQSSEYSLLSNEYNTLLVDLPLSAYETNKTINIKIPENTLSEINTYLNINSLGNKLINFVDPLEGEADYMLIFDGNLFNAHKFWYEG